MEREREEKGLSVDTALQAPLLFDSSEGIPARRTRGGEEVEALPYSRSLFVAGLSRLKSAQEGVHAE